MAKPILCLDFDGVIHSYSSGWKGADVVSDPPTDGALAFIREATEHFRVCIFSSRSNQPGGLEAMRRWFTQHVINFEGEQGNAYWASEIEWPLEKPAAMVTIDDRALTFSGDWSDFPIDRLRAFQPWNKRLDKITPALPSPDPKALEFFIERVLMDVCELPDRTSPDDQPEMMLVSGEELDGILRAHLPALLASAEPGERTTDMPDGTKGSA